MSNWSNVQIHRQVHIPELLLLNLVTHVKPRAWHLCLQYVKILRPESKAISHKQFRLARNISDAKNNSSTQFTHSILCL